MEIRHYVAMKRFRVFTVLCIVSAVLSACATQPPPPTVELPGFWSGLFHGFIMLFSLIGSIFTEHRIYAFPNAGGWYDLGFFLGASAFLGGGGASTR